MAGTYNLGSAVATIVITSDTKGVNQASDAVEDFGKKGERTGRVLDIALGNVIAQAAIKAVDAVAGLAGAIWELGMDRAVAIENAEAKMRGLGFSTDQVTGIMENALAAVKGTAYGLGDAATLAATAVAAGIEPGAALERQLSLVTNAAAASGTSLDDMGSIMRKVWTSGKVGTEELNQLADRGIPIYSKLAEAYGVSGEELRKMVSEGKLDLETFTTVLEDSVGSVAAEMGNTFEGASANAQAALGRLGAAAATNLLPHLTELMNIVIKLADEFGAKFGPVLADVASVVGETLVTALTGFIEGLKNTVSFIQDNITWLGPLAVAITTLVGVFAAWVAIKSLWITVTTAAKAAMIAFNAVLAANPIGLIVAAIAALVAGLIWFFTETELGREIWANFTKFLGEAWENVSKFLTEAWANISQFFIETWTNISTFFTDLWNNITGFIDTVVTGIVTTFEVFGSTVSSWWTGLWDTVFAVFRFVWEAIVNYVMTIVGVIIGIFTGDFSQVPDVVKNIWDTVMRFTQDVWNNVLDWLGGIPGWIKDIFNGAGDWLFNIGKDILEGLWNGLKDIWNGLVGWIGDIGNNIADTFAGVLQIHSPSRVFRGFGEDIMNGLMQGIESLEGKANVTVSDIGSGLTAQMEHNIDMSEMRELAAGRTNNLTYNNYSGNPGLESEDELILAARRAKVVVPGW